VTYAGSIAHVRGLRAHPCSLAGMQPKAGVTLVMGSGPIVGIGLDGTTRCVEVGGVGMVPLAWVVAVDGAPADLSAWWAAECAAWVARHGGDGSLGGDALTAEAARLRGGARPVGGEP